MANDRRAVEMEEEAVMVEDKEEEEEERTARRRRDESVILMTQHAPRSVSEECVHAKMPSLSAIFSEGSTPVSV